MAVKRSTLGLCRDSVLAKQFDDPRWKRDDSSRSVEGWDVERVSKWASETDTLPDEVARKLREHAIDGSALLVFGRDDLKEIGITAPGTLAKIIHAIQKLKNSARGDVVLVEESAYCFGKMIDQLRLRAMCGTDDEQPPEPEIREPDKKRFKRIVEYYFPGDEASSFILGRSVQEAVGANEWNNVVRGNKNPAANDTVLAFIQTHGEFSDIGADLTFCIRTLQNHFSESEVRSAIEFLEFEGAIYSTIDDTKYKYAL
mmetsp:Transcript_9232/g.18874  ORF Transcript_9232/g.18874 Transcript_9232/m.18874 type:complete len:257 (+) Transcript_9232:364-1134(+)